jgi:hypothetical protein
MTAISNKGEQKKVKLNLVGETGNAFWLIGSFKRQARKEGWTEDEIKSVVDEAKAGDYDHLLLTLMNYTHDNE